MRAAALLACLMLIGCDEPRSADPDAGALRDASQTTVEDAGTMPTHDDAGPPPVPDAGVAALDIAFTAPPRSLRYVRGTLALQLVVTGGEADTVELWKDGTILVALSAPYTYAWNTDLESETEHVLEARAIRDGAIAGRVTRSFVVDRTPPHVVERTPSPDALSARLADPIVVRFSEPISSVGLADAVALAVGDAPLAHTVELPMPSTVSVMVSERPAALPATATLTVGAAITDLAGNALGADDAWSFTYPAWVEHDALVTSGSLTVHDAAVAADGTIWVVYEVARGSGVVDLHAARWNGRVWYEIPTPVRASAYLIYEARVRTRASGRAVVAWSGAASGTDYETRVSELNGTSWVGYSAPSRSTEHARGIDLEIEADGGVVLSRRIDDDFIVHRYTGTWSQVGTTIAGVNPTTTGSADLLSTSSGLYFTYPSEYDCKLVQESGAGWTTPVDVLTASSSSSRCNSAFLVESGADGALYAFISRWSSGYPSTLTSLLRTRSAGGAWTDVSFWYGAPRSWISATSSPSGWYGLGAFSGLMPAQHVMDETLTQLEGDLANGMRVLLRDGEPVVVTITPSVFTQNALP